MYEAIDDPYCYPGTTVLMNKLGQKEEAELDKFEAEISLERSTIAIPSGNLSFKHYCAIHKHLFQDVYSWAGKPRAVRISKGEARSATPSTSIARRRSSSSN